MANKLENTIIDERTGWEYELVGDYYYTTGRIKRNGALTPNEASEDSKPETEQFPIGIWGQRHLNYIKRHKKSLYLDLFISSKLNSYLATQKEQAEDMYFRLVKQFAQQEGVTETLKYENQMFWVTRINSIYEREREIVNTELIFIE